MSLTITFNHPSEYSEWLVKSNGKQVTRMEYFKIVHGIFYSDVDISFMEYFNEIIDYSNEPKIPHSKLIEYGIMTSNQSCHVLEKLNNLGLKEIKKDTNNEALIVTKYTRNNGDYQVTDARVNENNIGRLSKIYTLSPRAFRLCLIRAQRRPNQKVDPTIYADYYIVLEEITKFYDEYVKLYERNKYEKTISEKDTRIDDLLAEVRKTNAGMDNLIEEGHITRQQLNDTLNKLDTTNCELNNVNDKLDTTSSKLDKTYDLLVGKCEVATMKPKKVELHGEFVILTKDEYNIKNIRILGRQKGNMSTTTKRYYQLENYETLIGPFYIPNHIDLKNNIKIKFEEMRNTIIHKYNLQHVKEVDAYNEELINQLRKQFRFKKDATKEYKNQKRTYKKYNKTNFPVTFKSGVLSYTKNEHMSYDMLVDMIKEIYNDTKEIPDLEEGKVEE